jgi:hypothetical protein
LVALNERWLGYHRHSPRPQRPPTADTTGELDTLEVSPFHRVQQGEAPMSGISKDRSA